MSRIGIGDWVRFAADGGQLCSGLVVGAASNGISRKLTVRVDMGGPNVLIHEILCEVAPPPRSRPVLACINGERIQP